MAAALGDGEITGGHVDAVARARSVLDEAGQERFDAAVEGLVEDAKTMPLDAFARRCGWTARRAAADAGTARQEQLRRQRCISRWVDADTGMCIARLALDPVTDAAMCVTVGLITGSQTVHPRVPEVSVHIDWDTLGDAASAAGVVCELDDGTPLPPATVRRRCCDADVIPAVLDGDGVVLDVGRSARLATCEQRQALGAMYELCGHPGCHVAFQHCRIHHVTDWTAQRGATDLANLLPLCSTHRHLVHEGGWSLTLRPDRTITLMRPDGTVHYEGRSINRHQARAGP